MSEVNVTKAGFRAGDTEYWRLEVAARKIGIHPQSLQRIYRNSGTDDYDRQGLRLGRQLFFKPSHLIALGYPIKEEDHA
jgi:hypothetical protein